MRTTIQIKLLGGLGNQMHQYASARAYAELFGAVLEVPDWYGRKMFEGLDTDLYYSRDDLPEVNDGSGSDSPQTIQWGQTNVRLGGYFQFQRWVDILSRKKLKQWFRIKRQWHDVYGPRWPSWYIAAHVRRADYVSHPLYATISEESYTKACEEYKLPLEKLMWVHQERPRNHPMARAAGIDFVLDFVALVYADVILRANSTFSWWAAVLSDADVFAPVVDALVGEHTVSFVRGNWPRCAHTARVGVRVEDLYLPE